MNAIMISIQPEYVEKILKGEKTIEIRKSFPKCDLPCKVFVYCTKGKNSLIGIIRKGEELPYSDGQIADKDVFYTMSKTPIERWQELGKVVAEFTLNKISTYDYDIDFENDKQKMYYIRSGELDKTCLTYKQLLSYGRGKTLYGWHIDNLKIYNKPKELGDFYSVKECPYKDWGDVDNIGCWECGCEMFSRGECRFGHLKLERPPQSWGYVEDIEEEE